MYWIIALAALVAGAGALYLAERLTGRHQHQAAEEAAQKLLADAETKQKEMLLEVKEEGVRIRASAEAEYRERRSELQRQDRRLAQKEGNLDKKLESVERRERSLTSREKDIASVQAQIEEAKKRQLQQLEMVSGLSSEEAKQFLLQSLEAEVREAANRRVREWETQVREEADARAREVLAMAIQRTASQVAQETTTSVVPLPSDEMKGRLIGREGRNIRALEQATGVDLIIDDTPEAVTLSCFDPVRREIARVALNKLILDGRIHPARIEDVVEKARSEVEATLVKEGEEAAYKVGVQALHPELVKLLGRLRYRTSYGQNVLQHSIEVAQLAGLIASELGFDVDIARKAGLLHDLGKGMDSEVEGTHAQIGARLVEQWEKSTAVVQAVAEHHLETSSTSLAGFVVSAADAVSGARPGARGEALEYYLQRLENLEKIANSFPGVEKSFAIQAGREVRIMVKPESVDDLGAARLARDVAKKIEETLQYPGQIKVTVIRETRAVDVAK